MRPPNRISRFPIQYTWKLGDFFIDLFNAGFINNQRFLRGTHTAMSVCVCALYYNIYTMHVGRGQRRKHNIDLLHYSHSLFNFFQFLTQSKSNWWFIPPNLLASFWTVDWQPLRDAFALNGPSSDKSTIEIDRTAHSNFRGPQIMFECATVLLFFAVAHACVSDYRAQKAAVANRSHKLYCHYLFYYYWNSIAQINSKLFYLLCFNCDIVSFGKHVFVPVSHRSHQVCVCMCGPWE